MELSEQPPSPTAAGAGYSCTSRCASAKTKAAVPLPGGAAASSHYGSLHGSRIRTAAGGEPTAERWRVPAFRLTTKKPPHAPKGRLSSRLRRLGSRMGTATRSHPTPALPPAPTPKQKPPSEVGPWRRLCSLHWSASNRLPPADCQCGAYSCHEPGASGPKRSRRQAGARRRLKPAALGAAACPLD